MTHRNRNSIVKGLCFVAVCISLAVVSRYGFSTLNDGNEISDTDESLSDYQSNATDADQLNDVEASEGGLGETEAEIVSGAMERNLNAWSDYDQHMKNRVVEDGAGRQAECSIDQQERTSCTFTPRKLEGRFDGFRITTNNDVVYNFDLVRDGIMEVESSEEPTPLGRFFRDQDDAACWSHDERKICVW